MYGSSKRGLLHQQLPKEKNKQASSLGNRQRRLPAPKATRYFPGRSSGHIEDEEEVEDEDEDEDEDDNEEEEDEEGQVNDDDEDEEKEKEKQDEYAYNESKEKNGNDSDDSDEEEYLQALKESKNKKIDVNVGPWKKIPKVSATKVNVEETSKKDYTKSEEEEEEDNSNDNDKKIQKTENIIYQKDTEEKEEEEEEESSSEEESESEESSSEDERPMFVPKFVSKDKRNIGNSKDLSTNTSEANGTRKNQVSVGTFSFSNSKDTSEKKTKTLQLAEENIKREIALEQARKSDLTDDKEIFQVDDTDDLDPEAEYAAWKIREIKRIQRDREEIEQIEKEKEAREEIKNMSAADRAKWEQKQDEEAAKKVQQEKEERRKKANENNEDNEEEEGGSGGSRLYMQQHYHKGAFFHGMDVLQNRDFSEALEDDYKDKSSLPKYLQTRGQTIGLKGRTKFRSLKEEDTTFTEGNLIHDANSQRFKKSKR